MAAKQNSKPLNRRQVLALRGLRVPTSMLKSMRVSGIVCEPAVAIVWLKTPDKYLIRARESGGAVAHFGAYCGFVSETGEPLTSVEKIESIGQNGFHALVMADSLVRVQAIRYEQMYDLLVTRHRLLPRVGKRRPRLENAILFHGVRGSFPSQPSGITESENGILPIFDDGAGSPVIVPEKFARAVALAIAGARCIGCTHAHMLPAARFHQEEHAG